MDSDTIYHYPEVDKPNDVAELATELSLPHSLAQILYLLDKKDAQNIKRFLFPEQQ